MYIGHRIYKLTNRVRFFYIIDITVYMQYFVIGVSSNISLLSKYSGLLQTKMIKGTKNIHHIGWGKNRDIDPYF